MENIETVPCEKCKKPLRTDSLKDGMIMIMLDGTEVNLCHRCAAIENGMLDSDFDCVWGEM